VPFLPSCSDIVPIGRVRWIAGTDDSSMENLFGIDSIQVTTLARLGPAQERSDGASHCADARRCFTEPLPEQVIEIGNRLAIAQSADSG
jgi:hypothetical protein